MRRNTEVTLTLWPEDSPANRSVTPGFSEGQKTPAFYGRRCIELYKSAGLHGSSLKMFSDLLVTQTEWSSSKCALIWKVKATKYNRLLFQLRVRTLFKKESGSGLLPALTASEAKKDKVTPGEHFKAFRQTKKQLPDCMYFESWFQSVRYYSELDGVVYGIPDWMDRTHALGNSIDPRIAYEILITIDYLINR